MIHNVLYAMAAMATGFSVAHANVEPRPVMAIGPLGVSVDVEIFEESNAIELPHATVTIERIVTIPRTIMQIETKTVTMPTGFTTRYTPTPIPTETMWSGGEPTPGSTIPCRGTGTREQGEFKVASPVSKTSSNSRPLFLPPNWWLFSSTLSSDRRAEDGQASAGRKFSDLRKRSSAEPFVGSQLLRRHPKDFDPDVVGRIGFEQPASDGSDSAGDNTIDPEQEETSRNSLKRKFIMAIKNKLKKILEAPVLRNKFKKMLEASRHMRARSEED